MIPLKVAIFEEIRKQNDIFVEHTDDQMNDFIFHHRDGLRLSYSGFLVIKKIFTAYSFAIPENLKTRHRYGMSKMEYPYFFTHRRLILFSEMDASVIKLSGGVENFLENCSQFE
jgi:hypothetical protein